MHDLSTIQRLNAEAVAAANVPLAHKSNTDNGKVIIIEDPAHFPFEPGERERDWRAATEQELIDHEAYWDARDPETATRVFSIRHLNAGTIADLRNAEEDVPLIVDYWLTEAGVEYLNSLDTQPESE